MARVSLLWVKKVAIYELFHGMYVGAVRLPRALAPCLLIISIQVLALFHGAQVLTY